MSSSTNIWLTIIGFVTSLIIFIAAIINAIAAFVQLRANTKPSPPAVDDLSAAQSSNAIGDYWLLRYLWRKQKLSLLLALLLATFPLWQAKLTGTSSAAFIFLMVHCTILSYFVCYVVMKMANLEFEEEYRRRKQPKP